MLFGYFQRYRRYLNLILPPPPPQNWQFFDVISKYRYKNYFTEIILKIYRTFLSKRSVDSFHG